MSQQHKSDYYNDYYGDFFEDIDITPNKLEALDFNFDADANVGLSQDNVHKLTEDLQNPLPPTEAQG